MKTKFKPRLYWLIHHGELLESTTEPISVRRAYVKQSKARNEVATRLRWMLPVKSPDLLPKSVIKADADWQKAYADRQKAVNENWKNIVKRHRAECPGCPFDYEKKTLIFPAL
jgi:hypothetical protein